MRPAMVANFVPFPSSARDDLGMFHDVFADHEKSGFNVMRSQQVEQFWRKHCARSVIESHGDVRTIQMHRVKSNADILRGGSIFLRCNALRRLRGFSFYCQGE